MDSDYLASITVAIGTDLQLLTTTIQLTNAGPWPNKPWKDWPPNDKSVVKKPHTHPASHRSTLGWVFYDLTLNTEDSIIVA